MAPSLLNSSLKKTISSTLYPYRNLETGIRTAFIPYSDIESIKEKLFNTHFFADLDIPNDYRLLMAEYPNTLSCTQPLETGELSLEYELLGTENAHFTMISLLRGNEWEYDCTQGEDEYVPNFNVPAPDLVNFSNLTWDGQSSWLDESNTIQITEISTESNSGVLIKTDYIKKFLQTSSLGLVFIGYQRKLLVNGHSRSPSIHEFITVYIFDGHNITQAYNFFENSQA